RLISQDYGNLAVFEPYDVQGAREPGNQQPHEASDRLAEFRNLLRTIGCSHGIPLQWQPPAQEAHLSRRIHAHPQKSEYTGRPSYRYCLWRKGAVSRRQVVSWGDANPDLPVARCFVPSMAA